MKRLSIGLFPAVLVFLTVPATAAVVTSLPSGVVVSMPAVNYAGPGPQSFGDGIQWTSTNADTQGGACFGCDGVYGFSGNGYWDGTLGPMAGLNSSYDSYGSRDSMTFAFSTPVSGVGGFLNYAPDGSTPTTIAVYDADHNLIELFDLSFVTSGGANEGAFYGFLESAPIISYFTLTDNYIGITGLTIVGTPEPSSLLLLCGGALVLAGAWRRRRLVEERG